MPEQNDLENSMDCDLNAWYFHFQWDVFAYFLGLISSIFYIVQIFLVYDGDYTDEIYVKSDLYGVAAAIIGLVQSVLFMLGWGLGRYYRHLTITYQNLRGHEIQQKNELPVLYDGNFWGNLILLIGSIGYQFTSVTTLQSTYIVSSFIFNIFLGVLFIIDSCFYFIGILQGEHSRASGAESVLFTSFKFHSSVDWYLIATIFFFFDSWIYLTAAIYDYYGINSNDWYVWGNFVLLFDSILYLVSSFHFRYTNEIPLWHRESVFQVEIKGDDHMTLLQSNND